jgi:hypothetical protein
MPLAQLVSPFACPIHDCLVTYERHADRVREIMEGAFIDRYGVRPTIKRKALHES